MKHFRSMKYITKRHKGAGAPVDQFFFTWIQQTIVYVIECKIYGKLYIRQTRNKLLQPLIQHLYYINRAYKVTELYTHFGRHGKPNLMMAGLEGRTCWSEAQRLAAERCWIHEFKS